MSATTVLKRADRLALRVEQLGQSALQHGVPAEELLQLRSGELSLQGKLVKHIDADEAVGGRFHDGSKAVTLSPNAHLSGVQVGVEPLLGDGVRGALPNLVGARTRCTGCACCPDTSGCSEKIFGAYPQTPPLASAAIRLRSGSMASTRLGHQSRISASRFKTAASRRLERLS